MNKAIWNYWVDVVIAIAFVLSAISGVVFLAPAFLVAQNAAGRLTFLGVPYTVWDTLHTWSSLALIVGVFAHLVLHWAWIVAMTRKQLAPRTKPVRAQALVQGRLLSRREFLLACSGAAVTLFVGGVLLRREVQDTYSVTPAPLDPTATAPSQVLTQSTATAEPPQLPPTPQALPTPTSTVVAPTRVATRCPRGLVNDPYPGRCRLYTDANKNGICDYSEV